MLDVINDLLMNMAVQMHKNEKARPDKSTGQEKSINNNETRITISTVRFDRLGCWRRRPWTAT